MAVGPGKYHDLCTLVRGRAEAESAIVIVVNGKNGSGFSSSAICHCFSNCRASCE
jgi:hypothetical protein